MHRAQIPVEAKAQDVAATLLAFFAALPQPLMPPEATQATLIHPLTLASMGSPAVGLDETTYTRVFCGLPS
jgi:hypothetical protein